MIYRIVEIQLKDHTVVIKRYEMVKFVLECEQMHLIGGGGGLSLYGIVFRALWVYTITPLQIWHSHITKGS